MPVPNYVTSIQQYLGKNEAWTVSAHVNATVTRYNNIDGQSYINNDTFWNYLFAHSDGNVFTLSSWQLFNGWDMGYIQGEVSDTDGTFCLAGNYPHIDTDALAGYSNSSSKDAQSFRRHALMFNTRREQCFGTWKITKDNITLLSGDCLFLPTNQTTLNAPNALPFPLDAMPVLTTTLRNYTVPEKSPWMIPSFTTSLATMYWARLVQMYPYDQTVMTSIQDLYYPSTNQTIFSTNTTLRGEHWALYLVLCIQPALTVLMFAWAIWFHRCPVQKGFGLVAMLAGVDR